MKPQVEFTPASAGSSTAGLVKAEPANGAPIHLGNGAALRSRALPRPNQSEQWLQLAAAAGRHWAWILLTVALAVAVGVGVGRKLWGTTYTATAQLVKYDTPDPQLFQPRVINPATLVGFANSAEVRNRAGARMTPAMTAEQVAEQVRVVPVPTTDLVDVAFAAEDSASATTKANIYAEEAVKFTQEMQARDARDAASYLKHQLEEVDAALAAITPKFQSAPAGLAPAATAVSPYQAKLDDARLELSDLQTRYTDAHPLVQMQKARVAALEKQFGAPAQTTPIPQLDPNAPPPLSAGEFNSLTERARSLELERATLTSRLQVTEMLAQNPPGHYKLFSPATAERAVVNSPGAKIALFAAFLGLCGLVLGVLGSVTDEALDRRLRTPADVRRVTGLPIIARLGSVEKMSADERSRWAFRTWTALQSRLSPSPNHGLVCGITASSNGEGRSVWTRLLAEAATQCGFRVAVITTKAPSKEKDSHEGRPASAAAAASVRFRSQAGAPKSAEPVVVDDMVLSDDLLGSPEESIEQILSEDGPSIVQIPLPGWVWNLEHRKEWLASLNAWGAHENMVVLVELPPASSPESVLLAQNLPNVLWLSDATKADALETLRQVETLRLARCHLIGAVMNRSSGTTLNERFARWNPAPVMAGLAIAAMLAGTPVAQAQDAAVQPAGSFSIVSPAQRASWQQQLTLGPGDTLRIALYGEPTATRDQVVVQPDGRVSFLEARDVVANGLTVDQLRQELDRELGKYRRSARTMISPVSFRSKKYHMLGLVAQKGAFTLDRPMTVVEAVARARGFETSATTGDVVELADLKHAFLVRNGERKPVDFQRLFGAGDLSQNIAVEPGDYFYFPPANLREVYVLGEVAHPGPAQLTEDSTSLRAIAATGGFTNKAWRGKVLVVRGSLNDPQPIVVNLSDVLLGRAADVALEPHDIVYVSSRPWWKAEELLDLAASAFTTSFTVYWTSDKVIQGVALPTSTQ